MSGERRSWRRWVNARKDRYGEDGFFICQGSTANTPVHVVVAEEGCPEEDWLFVGARVRQEGIAGVLTVITPPVREENDQWLVLARYANGYVGPVLVRALSPVPTTSRITLEGTPDECEALKRATSMKVVEG